MLLLSAVVSTAVNLVLFAGLPFLIYYAYQRRRHGRSFTEIRRRAGLQLGAPRDLALSGLLALVGVVALVAWPPPLGPLLRPGSPLRAFAGLGLGGTAITMALLHGVLKTGLSEELLFRGLVTGSLARRLPPAWADLVQALVFLVPHLLALVVMPELWGLLPVVFAGALCVGWIRMRSGSMLGPWLLHAALNVTMCLSVAVRTAA